MLWRGANSSLYIHARFLGVKYKSHDQKVMRKVSSVRRALASELRGPGFKSQPGTVGCPVTIIMWGARPGWISFELNPVTEGK